jgi:hypothetical protein
MIEVKITQEMLKSACEKAFDMGKIKNSITNGEGNIAGFLGEEVVKQLLDCEIKNTKDYDLFCNGLKYDVKTKRCKSEPKPFYECSIAAYNTKQRCDRYIFVRILFHSDIPVKAWVLGWMNKKEYFKKAHKLNKGDVDESNGFVVKADCYNLPIEDLNEIHPLTCSL